MSLTTVLRLCCDSCGTTMRGRDERPHELRQRAARAGWRFGPSTTTWRDLCQVCAAKER